MHPKKLEYTGVAEYHYKDIFQSENKFRYAISYVHDNTIKFSFPIAMHSHSFCEINIITEGSGWHYMENNCVEATKGSVYVIPENFQHGYFSEDPDNFKILHILLSPFFLERYKDELHSIPGFTILWDIEPLIRDSSSHGMFLRLNETQLKTLTPEFNDLLEHSDDKPENNIQELSKALDIISKLSSLMFESHKTTDKKHSYDENANLYSIVKTMEYMKENYGEKISIDMLLKIANMSKSNYIASFKTLSRYTPIEYLTEIRVEKAKEMLFNTQKTVSTIAQDCGFFDSSHFTSTFKKKTGQSPKQYRKEKSYVNDQ